MEESRWKVITGVEGHTLAEQMKMLSVCDKRVRSNRRLTGRMIADELRMNSERVWRIITKDLGMGKTCAKMVSRLLNKGQKERRVQVCQDILEQLETELNLL